MSLRTCVTSWFVLSTLSAGAAPGFGVEGWGPEVIVVQSGHEWRFGFRT